MCTLIYNPVGNKAFAAKGVERGIFEKNCYFMKAKIIRPHNAFPASLREVWRSQTISYGV